MSTVTLDLQATLKELDADSASKLERLVRDAIALAQPSKAKPVEVDAKGWPVGHFEKFAGCLAGEQWDLPDDPPPEPIPEYLNGDAPPARTLARTLRCRCCR